MHPKTDQCFVATFKPSTATLACQHDFRNQCKVTAPHAGHPGGQGLIIIFIADARQTFWIENHIGGAGGIHPRMRFNGLDQRVDHLVGHRADLGRGLWPHHNARRKDGHIHIAALQAGPLRQITDSGPNADLIMQIINNFIGDGIVQNAACRTDHEMILQRRIRGHGRKAVDARPTFQRRKIQRLFQRHHAGFLFHRRIDDHGTAGCFGKTHATRHLRMAGGGAKNKTGESQHQNKRQFGQVEPAALIKSCIEIEDHNGLRPLYRLCR